MQEDVLAAVVRRDEPITARSVEAHHTTSGHADPQPPRRAHSARSLQQRLRILPVRPGVPADLPW